MIVKSEFVDPYKGTVILHKRLEILFDKNEVIVLCLVFSNEFLRDIYETFSDYKKMLIKTEI